MWRQPAVLSVLFACGAPQATEEDLALSSLAEAYAAGDCAAIFAGAPAFTSLRQSRNDEVTYYYGRCYQKDGDLERAIELLEKVSAYGPRADDALYYLGRAYYDSGRYSEAAAAFDRLIAEHAESSYLDNAYYRRILVS